MSIDKSHGNVARGRSSTEKQVAVYTPESQLRSPAKLVSSLGRDLLASRELAWRLMIRDINSRYRQTFLGIFWAFFTPVAAAMMFVMLNRQGLISVKSTEIPYPAYVLIGTVLWQVFVDSLQSPLKVVNKAKSMLTKANFPREALILSGVGQVLFETGIRTLILVVVFILFDITPTWGLIWSPLGMLMLLVLGITLGTLLVPIGTLYGDVTLGLTSIIMLWFFMTPVVYPTPVEGTLATLLNLNPVTPLLVGTRDLLTIGHLSDPVPFLIVTVITLVAFLVAWLFYRIALPILAERLGS